MIDMIYNLHVVDIHTAEFSDEFNKLCIPFEDSLSDISNRIREAVEGLGSLPTLTKPRAFIESLKEILNERSGE